MAVSTVKLNGTTLMTVNDTTAVAADVASSKYFYAADGTKTAGTASGGGAAEEKDVIFIDYDGTVLYSYTPTEFAALSAMPSNPDHTSDGLTSQGWNWTLADAKTYVAAHKFLTIGQTYVPTDGKTHVFIHIDERDPVYDMELYIGHTASTGSSTIDWGDNSTDTFSGSSVMTRSHTYATYGDYEITINTTTGTLRAGGSGSGDTSKHGFAGAEARLRQRTRKIYFGNNVQLANYAVGCAEKLSAITLPSSIDITGSYMFTRCYGLKSIIIPSGVVSVGSDSGFGLYAFNYCYTLKYAAIPKSMAQISGYMFQYCYSLESVAIQDAATYIGTSAFAYCYNARNLYIPSGVTTLGGAAFQYCYKLQSATIPSNITAIPNSLFSNCTCLTSVTLHNNITSIGSSTFAYTLIEEITLPDGITSIGDNAFSTCVSLRSINLPADLTTLGSSAFTSCYLLQQITVPNNASLATIGNSAFYYCYNLESFDIPSTVTTVGNYALQNCYRLNYITIPEDVTSIGSTSFFNNYGVIAYHILPEDPPTLGTTVFGNMRSGTVMYVPYSSDHSILNTYKTATNWSSYASYMQEEPQ